MLNKKVKVRYNVSGEIIEIKVRDFSGRFLESYKFDARNSKMYGDVIETLFRKYGFRPVITSKDSINIKEKFKSADDLSFFEY